MNPIFQTLLTMTATASVVALAVMVLRLPLKKAPRWITCCLWVVVFLRMVCPVSFSLPVSLVPASIAQGTYLQIPAAQEPDPSGQTPVQAEVSSPVVAPADTAPGQASAPETAQAAPSLSWPAVATGLWLAGSAGMLLWGLVSYLRLKGRLAEAVLFRDNIYESDRIDGPFVCGFVHPCIYLPTGMAASDRRYVLLHEEAHIRRRDHLAKPLAWLALCLHWWNPLLWLAYQLLCRDIESACDQAVIRSFDTDHTVQYATTLLRLGRKPTLPRAVPLAFGEENPKGRIQHVLRYKHPGLWVVAIALVVCVVAGVLMLANPGKQGAQLEGVSITESTVQLRRVAIPLPDELRQDLVDLVKAYDQEDYASLESYTPADGALCLSDPNGGTQFYLEAAGTQTQLVRINHDGYSSTRKVSLLDEGFLTDQRWLDFQSSLDTYLSTGWAQAVYQCKTPYIGDASACQALLEALYVSQVVGPYTISLQTEAEPYGITLQFSETLSQDQALYVRDYLTFCGTVFLDLVENAGLFQWELPMVGQDTPLVSFVDGALYQAETETEFMATWSSAYGYWMKDSSPIQTSQGQSTYSIGEILYWAREDDPQLYLPSSSFVLQSGRFTATMRNGLLSSMPTSEDFPSPSYRSLPLSDLEEFPGLKDLVPSTDSSLAFYQICDSQGQETHYYCLLGQSIYLAHTDPGDPQSVDYVVRLATSPAEGQPQVTAGTYREAKVLYLSSSASPGINTPNEMLDTTYSGSTYEIQPTLFSARLVNLLSSAYPETETLENPRYEVRPLSDLPLQQSLLQQLTEALGLDGDLSSQKVLWICDSQGQEAGYCLYPQGDTLYLAHLVQGEDGDFTLAYLFQLAAEADAS